MMILIIGGSGSGKSSYAESLAASLAEKENIQTEEIKKYYLATMKVFGEEERRKVERHKKLRHGKGFITIEQPTDIHKALEKVETRAGIALLECISNLTANEMFAEKREGAIGIEAGTKDKAATEDTWKIGTESENEIAGKIEREIGVIKEKMEHLIVVSNNVFEDGIAYDETTMAYIRVMGSVNRRLAAMADEVVEVAAGIPLIIK